MIREHFDMHYIKMFPKIILNLMLYDGNPEIKEQAGNKYLYVRKRIAGKLTSIYMDVLLGYEDRELPRRIVENMDFARENMKSNIYDQAVLEGVATSFP